MQLPRFVLDVCEAIPEFPVWAPYAHKVRATWPIAPHIISPSLRCSCPGSPNRGFLPGCTIWAYSLLACAHWVFPPITSQIRKSYTANDPHTVTSITMSWVCELSRLSGTSDRWRVTTNPRTRKDSPDQYSTSVDGVQSTRPYHRISRTRA
jgi:hypothetical protein